MSQPEETRAAASVNLPCLLPGRLTVKARRQRLGWSVPAREAGRVSMGQRPHPGAGGQAHGDGLVLEMFGNSLCWWDVSRAVSQE